MVSAMFIVVPRARGDLRQADHRSARRAAAERAVDGVPGLVRQRLGPELREPHFFGTDGVGRDVFSRTLYGARDLARGRVHQHVPDGADRRRRSASPPATTAAGPTRRSRASWTSCSRSRCCCWRSGLGAACSVGEGLRDQGRPDRGDHRRASRSSGRSRSATAVLTARRRGHRITTPEILSRLVWPAIGFVLGLVICRRCSATTTILRISPGLPVVIFVIVDRELALHRAHHPRPDAVAAREGVRRGGARARRLRPAHHVPAHPAEPGRADHRLHDAADPARRSCSRRRSRSSASASAADRQLGRDDLRRHRRSSTPPGGT